MRQVPRLTFGNEPELEHSVRLLELETKYEMSPFELFDGCSSQFKHAAKNSANEKICIDEVRA